MEEEAFVQEGNVLRINGSPLGLHVPRYTSLETITGVGARISGDFSLRGSVAATLDIQEMHIKGNAYLHGVEVTRNANLRNMHIQGHAYMHGFFLSYGQGRADFHGMKIDKDADFSGMIINGTADFGELQVAGVLRLDDAFIAGCDNLEGLVVRSYSLNSATKIPGTLRDTLKKYKQENQYPQQLTFFS